MKVIFVANIFLWVFGKTRKFGEKRKYVQQENVYIHSILILFLICYVFSHNVVFLSSLVLMGL